MHALTQQQSQGNNDYIDETRARQRYVAVVLLIFLQYVLQYILKFTIKLYCSGPATIYFWRALDETHRNKANGCCKFASTGKR